MALIRLAASFWTRLYRVLFVQEARTLIREDLVKSKAGMDARELKALFKKWDKDNKMPIPD
jgi:transcription elongation factor GreA-like protein